MSVTLAELIARYESTRPAAGPVLTPAGSATVTARRFARELAALDDRDRAGVLTQLLADLKAVEPVSVEPATV